MPPTQTSRLLLASATAAAVCLLPAYGSPAFASSNHQSHPQHKTQHGKGHKKHPGSTPKPGQPASEPLNQASAGAAALKSAAPLIVNAADKASVTGCSVAGPAYNCGLELHAADSASTCRWSVVVQETRGAPAVISYSRIDCSG